MNKFKNINHQISGTPMIPQAVYDGLPEFLKELCSRFEDRERDVFFVAVLGILSGMLAKVNVRYRNRVYNLPLFIIIIAPPGAGKGVMVFAKHLAKKMHQHLIEKKTGLIIPGNISAARIYQLLKRFGETGIIIESELDTIVNSLKQDWGSFDDLLRKAFEHEACSLSRKLDDETIEIDRPKLAMIISGTPAQLQGLIQSAENGLFSRFFVYIFNADSEFKDVEPTYETNTDDSYYEEMGLRLAPLVAWLNKNPVEMRFTPEQWGKINQFFTNRLHQLTTIYGSEADGIVKRSGIMLVRIASILTLCRLIGENDEIFLREHQCSEVDFQCALQLIDVGLEHSVTALQILTNTNSVANKSRYDTFYARLPWEFTRKEAMVRAREINIPERTADRYLNTYVGVGRLTRDQQGRYTKPEAPKG